MSESSPTNDLVKDFERVVKKAIEANTAYYKEAAAALQRVYSGKSELSGQAVVDSLADAFTSLVKLQLRYAENLYDLQHRWSKDMAQQGAHAAADNAGPVQVAPEPERKSMTLSSPPGETPALMLRLHSRDSAARHCRFEHTGFAYAQTGKAAPLSLVCDPESFSLTSGQEVEAKLVVGIPENAEPGAYLNTVTIHGYDDSVFDLIVVVEPKATPEKTAAQPKSAKTPSRKSKKQTDGEPLL